LAREHGLADRVALAGWETCPARVLGQASLFALSSRHEGFPISLMEAMACAVPVVSFACPSGPAEIVRHQVDGLLVPAADVIALAGALDRLMRDADLRAQMGRRAQEVVQRFGQQQFLHRWDQAIRQAVSADG
jgi:glycosyltransferase involved in cell wall biosynthesis